MNGVERAFKIFGKEGDEKKFRGFRKMRGPPPEKGEILIKAENVVKGFPGVWEHLILDHINFDVRAGEVHALLGENGAGKTVLANILSGFYVITSGQIYVRGKPVKFNSPRDALEHGIAMVHQEFTLVPTLTVAENIALGLKEYSSLSFPLKEVERKLAELSERYGLKVDPKAKVEDLSAGERQRYGLKVDPKAKVEDLSAGERQRAEIMKVLYWEPDVLILDEPTSMLTPHEADELFKVLRGMAAENKGVVFITHRIEEVMKVADRVTVLRLGKFMGTKSIKETTKEELLKLMIGEVEPFRPIRKPVKSEKPVLEVIDLHVVGREGVEAVRGVTFTVREGEIFGIAGVAGNGQRELVEALTGLRKVKSGKIIIMGKDVTRDSGSRWKRAERTRRGVNWIEKGEKR